jgi:hypothetical protein
LYLPVDLAGHVAFETADDLAFRHALLRASFEVGARAGVSACHDDAVEGGVGLAVAAAVQPSSPDLSGELLDGADAAQSSEGYLVGQPVRVVASGDQQGSGTAGPDADDV